MKWIKISKQLPKYRDPIVILRTTNKLPGHEIIIGSYDRCGDGFHKKFGSCVFIAHCGCPCVCSGFCLSCHEETPHHDIVGWLPWEEFIINCLDKSEPKLEC